MPSLDALLDSDVEVAGVVTNPDRPAGRGMDVTASPVKERAQAAGLEVLQPPKARAPEFIESIASLSPDIAVVVAYGKILPVDLLAVPPLGFVNVHFSLLPAYRGAAPVQRAVMNGDRTTGVSFMVLTEGMDEGPVLATEETPIGERDTAGDVGERLALMGAALLVPTLRGYERGELVPADQDHDAATYAPKITSDEGRIDWTAKVSAIDALVRGLNPVPGAWTELEGTRLKVHAVEPAAGNLQPGEVTVGASLTVGAGDGALELTEVQMAGKKRMSGTELARGLRLSPGARVG